MVDKSKAVVPYLRKFDEDELSLLRTMLAQVAPKASGDEKRMFLYAAQKKGLDPFDKQIYLVPRWDSQSGSMKHSVQVSIDGLRLMAQRSGKYAGQTPYQWCGSDAKWVDVWLSDEQPLAARVGILRHDFKEPLYSVALFKSYKQTKKDGSLNTFWEKYGAHMLAKCAEALSIRRAFPEETSGFYIPEEMGHPEVVYVAETEQDNEAPFAEGELVDESSNQTNGAKENTTVSPTTKQANNGTTSHATGRSTVQAVKSAAPVEKPPVVNPSANTSTTKPSPANKTVEEGDNKKIEGQSEKFTQNSHRLTIIALKKKAIEVKFIDGKDQNEKVEMWGKRLYAIFRRTITDEELAKSQEMLAQVDEAIERYAKQHTKPEPLTGDAVALAKEYREIVDRKVDGKFASDQDMQRVFDISEEMSQLGYQMNVEKHWQKINKAA